MNILKLATAFLLLGSCASTDRAPNTLSVQTESISETEQPVATKNRPAPALTPDQSATDLSEQTESLRFDVVPRITPRRDSNAPTGEEFPPLTDDDVSVSLSASQSIVEFIDVVYGDILGTGYVLGPGVEDNPGVINLRTPASISSRELYETARETLKLHAISVSYSEGEVKIYEDSELRETTPKFIPSRARRSVPAGLQPIVQFVEIYARDLNEMANILQSAFPDRDELTVSVNRSSNSLTLAGLPDDISMALDIIDQMDELAFAGSEFAVYRSKNWDASDLSQALETFLRLSGYSVTSQNGVTATINIMPVEYTQQIYIFARRPDFLEFAVQSVQTLDRDASRENVSKTRVYKVQHYLAEDLVQVLERVSQLRTGGSINGVPNSSSQIAQTAGSETQTNSNATGRFVVDEQGNRIIFESNDEDYLGLLQLLRQIDVPASEVLIEVTIAEVTLTDDTQSGLEFLFQQIGSRGFAVGLGTRGGLGLGDGGLLGSVQSGDYIIDFSALATNNQVNVLSSPRIVTKSGSDASIQVGTDVPIILSQSAGLSQSGGTTDILQTVQYRETGIILNITPLVLSNDRIDLTITQEVSAAEANVNQAIASPVISNRSLQTALTLQDGQSAILGGLIENRYTRGSSGVPLLKDIPVIGRAFNTETLTASQTVLMVMITPYVLNSRSDRAEAVDELAEIVNEAFLNQIQNSTTLETPTEALRVEPKHVLKDSPQ